MTDFNFFLDASVHNHILDTGVQNKWEDQSFCNWK